MRRSEGEDGVRFAGRARVAVAALVVGAYFFGAVIWDWPFPGRTRADMHQLPAEEGTGVRRSLAVTERIATTYSKRLDAPLGGRMLQELHIGLYAANPNDVPVKILACRFENVAVQLAGAVDLIGAPPATPPAAVAYEKALKGHARMDGADPEYDSPPVIGPGRTVELDCVFFLPLPEDREHRGSFIIPLGVRGTVALVDEWKDRHLSDPISLR